MMNHEPKVAPAADAPAKPKATILVVDDEPGVLRVVQMKLNSLGYKVLAADGPKEALQQAEAHDGIDLLLTDIVMPKMSGYELALRLLDRQENLRCLFMSGFPDDGMSVRETRKIAPFIRKPFTTYMLAAKISEALES